MPGKRQKHPSQLQGHRPKTAMTVIPAGAGQELPPPPLPHAEFPRGGTWQPMVPEMWAKMWTADVAVMWDRRSEEGPAFRYILTFDQWLRIDAELRKKPTALGSQKQMVANPLWNVRRALGLELRGLEEKLGLTGLDRLRMGIDIGAAMAGLKQAADLMAEASDEDEFAAPDGWEVVEGEVVG